MARTYSRYEVKHPTDQPSLSMQNYNIDQLTGAIIGHFKAQHEDIPMMIRARKGFNAVEGCNVCKIMNKLYKEKAKAAA